MLLRIHNFNDDRRAKPVGFVLLVVGFIVSCVSLPSRGADAASAATSESGPKQVLVVYSDERLLPANVIVDDAIRKTFAAEPASRIEFYSEFLDVSRFSGESGKPVEGIKPDAMQILVNYHWPGNVRELQNIVERSCALAKGSVLEASDIHLDVRPTKSASAPGGFLPDGMTLEQWEDEMVQEALRRVTPPAGPVP